MFAVIKTGGKQYPVKLGSILKVEKLDGEIGSVIPLDDVIFASQSADILDKKKIAIKAEILEQKRDKKIIIFKKRRRKNYKRKNGHRQHCSVIKIIGIDRNGN